MANEHAKKPVIALYASPECCKNENLRLYKSYFNVAWFVRAYSALLFEEYRVITTDETWSAVMNVTDKLDEQLVEIWDSAKGLRVQWKVPFKAAPIFESPGADFGAQLESLGAARDAHLESLGRGFDAQVELAAMVAKGAVDRLLMFQDPDDIQTHLPEAYALIRNCTLANVGLNINAGATFWAETQWQKKKKQEAGEFGPWRTNPGEERSFHALLNPSKQKIAFISHDSEKPKMSRLIYHYRNQFNSPGFELTGTSGTCQHAREYLSRKDTPHWEMLDLRAAGAAEGAGHGPTGGDVVIAAEVILKWACEKDKKEEFGIKLGDKNAHKMKRPVRTTSLSHTVIFFIDHRHAQPHEADIQVLLRTCLHPSHGVHVLLNERSAQEWAQTLRDGTLSTQHDGEAE